MSLTLVNETPQTMSSREIAELTGKQVGHVNRDAERMIQIWIMSASTLPSFRERTAQSAATSTSASAYRNAKKPPKRVAFSRSTTTKFYIHEKHYWKTITLTIISIYVTQKTTEFISSLVVNPSKLSFSATHR